MRQSISHSGELEDSMLRYDKNNVEELKVFLYNSYVHDAKIENVIFIAPPINS